MKNFLAVPISFIFFLFCLFIMHLIENYIGGQGLILFKLFWLIGCFGSILFINLWFSKKYPPSFELMMNSVALNMAKEGYPLTTCRDVAKLGKNKIGNEKHSGIESG